MARTDVPITDLTANGAQTISSTAIDAANGHNINLKGKFRKFLLRVNNTTVAPKAVTIKAGANLANGGGPALRAAIGDLVLTIPASTVQAVQVESARFEQADGSLNIDIAAGMTGTLEALRLGQGNA